jgi:RHS repeat-associated protein
LGNTSTSAYDAIGNLIASTDGLGHSTQYSYDALSRKTSIIDATGQTTQMSYDANGNLTRLIDPSGNATQYQYDNLNRVTQDTNTLNASRTYSYDAVGHLTQTTDRNNRTRSYSYDALDRQTQENWLDSTGTVIHTSTAAYDSAGQLISISDPDSRYTYSYDPAGRLTTVDNTGTPNTPSVILTYSYDPANNLTSVADSINGQQKGTTAYSYDSLNRATQITQSGNGVSNKRIDLAYNQASQTTQIARYSDLSGNALVAQSDYSYDTSGRLTQLSHTQNSTTYANYEWSYDSRDRITQSVSPDGTNVYSYNNRNELIGTDSNYQTDEAYGYDATGNRTNAGYQTGTDNRLLSDGTYNYTYDNEGNRTNRTSIATGELTRYTWDYRNRLTSVTTQDSSGTVTKSVAYTYDVYGQRIAKSVDADGVGAATPQTERMVYDGDNIALTFDETGTQTHRYLYGPGVDQILADETPTDVNWALVDNQGTVRDVINSQGQVLNHIVYDSYGQMTSETNSNVDFRYGYTGRERDEETGLNYYRARYYDTTTGAFLSEDPMGFAAGDYNLSRYVFGSPTNWNDPSGLNAASGENPFEGFFNDAAAAIGAAVISGLSSLLKPLSDTIGPNLEFRTHPYPIPQAGPTPLPLSKSTPQPNPKSSPSPRPSRDPKPLPLPTDLPGCEEEEKKKPCSGAILGGTYNQVSYSNRGTGSTPHHMPGWAAIKASGISLGQTKSYYKTKTPTACLSSIDHESTESLDYTEKSIAYVKKVSAIIKTQGFYDAQLVDIKEIQTKFPGKYNQGIVQMQNYTLNLIATESDLFK